VTAEKLIILFPQRALGMRIIQNLPNVYRLVVFVLSEEELHYFKRLKEERKLDMQIVHAKDTITDFWNKHGSVFNKSLNATRGVINFMGRDWLKMRIEQNGVDWKINHSNPENKKLALAENILHALVEGQPVIWINLAYGTHKPSADGRIYCNTRYGLTGFSKAIELTPGLQNVVIINICMNYFFSGRSKTLQLHCRNCVSAQFMDAKLNRKIDNDFLLSVIESVGRSESVGQQHLQQE
jgi:hypothetical protein